MPILLWDTSSLIKRFTIEPGTDTVNAIFNLLLSYTMVFTFVGYAEAYAILRRRYNGGQLGSASYQGSRSALRNEVLRGSAFSLLPVSEAAILASLSLIDQHNINSTDAAILATYLDFQSSLSPKELPTILIASDHRLLRAAAAEGLQMIDPEVVAAGDIHAVLAAL